MNWIFEDDPKPYNSFGNGSAMRVSPIGWAFDSLEETREIAKLSASVTHDHPEGVKGAEAVASAIFLARNERGKEEIKEYIEYEFGYDLSRYYLDIWKDYSFDVTCQGSVPEAIIAFLVSEDFESAIRFAVALGGDADTQAAIAGSIAEAYYVIPTSIIENAKFYLSPNMLEVIDEFRKNFIS